ncbi:MAG: electron transfer flavoprotein subunit beta [Dehalococcoidia bacterium]|nr:electron transfer flavoprotein subunit beta [Dehalococcoidia bacterium]
MHIIALIKQVADTAQLSRTVDGLRLMAEGGPRIVNPWDEYAIEAALQLKEAHGGDVTLLCMGEPEAIEALRAGIALGADAAILLSDPAMKDSDTLGTARLLAAAITKIGEFDLVIGGRAAIDGNTAATTVQVAALLGIPQVSYVGELKALDPAAHTITAVRLLEHGRETVTSTLPAAITVVKEINEPRYPSLIGIRRAARATIPIWTLGDLGLEPSLVGLAGAQARWPEVTVPPGQETNLEIIAGTPTEAAEVLADRLMAAKVI